MPYPPSGAPDPRPPEALDELPPALSELDGALLRDGAVWRRRLPDASRAAQRAVARLHGTPRGASSSPSTYQASRTEPRAAIRSAPSPRAAGRTRGLVAVAAAVAVVGLLAALLHALNPVRGLTTTATRGTPTASPAAATATSTPNPWTALPGYDDPATRKLVVEPSDPRVAYAILAGAPSGATVTPSKFAPPPTYQLRRTDDGGASWRALNLPIAEPQNGQESDYGIQSLAVSPADANTVFVAIQLGTASLCDQYVGSGLGKSGSVCLAQYVSRDGGQQWQPLRLPAIAPQQPGQSALGARITTQGDRLYATIGDFCACGGTEPTGRIGVSTDGGLTWTLADAGLVNQGRGADRFAVSPSGSALFAVAEPVDATLTPVSATPPYPPGSLELWRSDDAGASWMRIGAVPHNAANDLAVAPTGDVAHPVLYLVTDADASAGTFTKLAAPILSRSLDGGQTWAPVAVTGLPSGASIEPSLPATLDDGSALVSVSVSGGSALYAWAPATSAWRRIAPPFTAGTVSALIVAPQGAAQPQAIYVVSDRGVQRYPAP